MKVTLFRDLPTEGFRSMEVVAERLAAAFAAEGFPVAQYVLHAPSVTRHLQVPLNYLWRMLVYPLAARRHQGDLNHVIDHSYGNLLYAIDPRRTVVTCHDLRPLVFPDPISRWGLSVRLWHIAFRGMLRAAYIIADSESTRRDLLSYAAYPSDRVMVVPLGVDHDTFYPRPEAEQARVRSTYRLPMKPLLLHVGHCGPRKNVETLLETLAMLRGRGQESVLVQAGGRFTPRQLALIERLGVAEHVYQISYVQPGDLPALYTLADVVMLPSWYEGFGLPVLEAMACGTPVVAADSSSLPEVVGEAGLLIPPADHAGFAAAAERIIRDHDFRQELANRGLAHAQRYSWERCARDTRAVYEQVGAQ